VHCTTTQPLFTSSCSNKHCVYAMAHRAGSHRVFSRLAEPSLSTTSPLDPTSMDTFFRTYRKAPCLRKTLNLLISPKSSQQGKKNLTFSSIFSFSLFVRGGTADYVTSRHAQVVSTPNQYKKKHSSAKSSQHQINTKKNIRRPSRLNTKSIQKNIRRLINTKKTFVGQVVSTPNQYKKNIRRPSRLNKFFSQKPNEDRGTTSLFPGRHGHGQVGTVVGPVLVRPRPRPVLVPWLPVLRVGHARRRGHRDGYRRHGRRRR
jgi:hypothetical protein